LAIAALTILALVTAHGASASALEIGIAGDPLLQPSCPASVGPSQCFIVLARTTALQSKTAGVTNPTRISRAGFIVSFSVGLSDLSPDADTRSTLVSGLDHAYGTPEVELTILRPRGGERFAVVARSPVFKIQAKLGSIATYSVPTPIQVSPGDRLALTVPTWAPVLTYDLSPRLFATRYSRASRCAASTNQTAQTSVGTSASYRCLYTGTRVQYAARELITASPLSPFRVAVVLHTQPGKSGEVTLLRMLVDGVSRSTVLSGGVLTPDSRRHSKLVFSTQTNEQRSYTARPPLALDGRSRIILGVSRAGRVGRFKLYRVEPEKESLSIIAQGCTLPGTAVNVADAAYPGRIPRATCG
jgi:hypothetical protein